MLKNPKGLYVIQDTVANDTAPAITMHRAEAAAVREFSELLTQHPMMSKHPQDFQLVRVGFMEDESLKIVPNHHVIVTGAALAAASNPPQLVKES